jgi:uncharacterized protein
VTASSLDLKFEDQTGPEQSIARLATARTAFVGRTLRGPVERPVFIKSFAEFQQEFGGLWQPSPLGYAVEQFFDNGGREALIVRVVNGARAATLSLRAGDSWLKLQALRPGTREFLRVSVDYDNIPELITAYFNLTVQRVRAQGTNQVEDQEIFQKVCLLDNAEGFLPKVLSESQLVRILGPLPPDRPERTLDPASGLATAYVHSNPDGDDGAPLSDYDLIGSQIDHTGLFALDAAAHFNFLCIPPLSREHDVGCSTLLVAARYCRERHALLIVDPPAHWHTADEALAGLRDYDLFSEDSLMFFPHILAHDKLRGHFEAFAPCGAVAGMLARNDEMFPLWDPERSDEAVLRPGYRPTCLVAEDRRARLALAGVNTIQGVRTATRVGPKPRTLAAGRSGNADWQYLSQRRLALYILSCIEHGTRWVLEARPDLEVAELLVDQVRIFFEALFVAGAFGSRRIDEAYFVICDQRAISHPHAQDEFQFLIGFAASREHEFHAYRITHSRSGSRVQAVSLNRLNMTSYSPAEMEWVDNLASQFDA